MSVTFMVAVFLLAVSSVIFVVQYTSSIVPIDLGPQATLSLLVGPDSLRAAELSSISTDNSYISTTTTKLHAINNNAASTTSQSPHHNDDYRRNRSVTVDAKRPLRTTPRTHPIDSRPGNASLTSRFQSLNALAVANQSRQGVQVAPMPIMPNLTIRHANLSFTSGPASHIFTRVADQSWSPKAKMLQNLPTFDRLLFPSQDGASQATTTTTAEHRYLGFIRMTKTGSTSLLNFLNAATQLQTLDKYIRHDAFRRQVEQGGPPGAMRTAYLTPPCMFGFHRAPDQTVVDKSLPSPGYQCQHLAYHYLVSNFANILNYYKHPNASAATDSTAAAAASLPPPDRVLLDMTTVVRDPVDRYLSFFHYWRSVYPAWNATAKDNERVALVTGDFEEFLRIVASHDRRGMNSAFQYEYLSQNVDYSIALVSDRRVLPLVNECFNASLLLLTDLYPQFFSVNETLHFLQTSEATTNSRNKAAGPNLKMLALRGLEPVKEFDLDAVKARAHHWLERDYRFYETSASMFLRHLEVSAVDPDEVDRCRRRLRTDKETATTTQQRRGVGDVAAA